MSLSTYDNSNFKGFHHGEKKNVGSACHQRMAETIDVDCSVLLYLKTLEYPSYKDPYDKFLSQCEPGKTFFKINSTLPFLALNNKSYKNLHFPLLHLAVRKPGAKFCAQMLLFVLARSFFPFFLKKIYICFSL